MLSSISLRVRISLLLLATMGVMSGVAIVASLPLIAQHFSDIENITLYSKLLLTLPSIIIALIAPFVGILVDRIGRLKPLYVGIALFIVGGSSGFYLDNFYAILGGRALLGVAVALIMTSTMALIGDLFDEKQRHHFMSLQGMTVGLGGIVFILSGGLLADIKWQYPFLIYLLPLLFLPLLWISLKEPKQIKHLENDAQLPQKLYPVYLTGFFSMLLFYMLPTQLPYLVVNELQGSPSQVGYFIAFAMLINAAISKQYHRLKARFSFARIFAITYLFFAIGLLIISAVNEPNQLFFASVFMGVGFGLVMVNINVWLLSLVEPARRGRAIGLLTSSFFFGQFFSPVIFQPVVMAVGIQGLFLVTGILSLCVSAVIFIKSRFKGVL